MTSELLVAMFDAATDRIRERARAAFADGVEQHRMGTIFASGREGDKAYRKWTTRMAKAGGRSVGLAGASLERAIANLAAAHPQYVVMGN